MIFILKFVTISFERQRETETEFPSSDPLPPLSMQPQIKWPGPGQAEVKSPELNPGIYCGWQGLNYLSCHLLPPRICTTKKLGSEESQDSNPGNQIRGVSASSSLLTSVPNTCPLMVF